MRRPLRPGLSFQFQNLEKMLTDDDRKHIERQTGVAVSNGQGKQLSWRYCKANFHFKATRKG